MNIHWTILLAGLMWLGTFLSVLRLSSARQNRKSCEQRIAELEKEHPDAAPYGNQFEVEAYESLECLDSAVDRWGIAINRNHTASIVFLILAVVFTVLAFILN